MDGFDKITTCNEFALEQINQDSDNFRDNFPYIRKNLQ